MNQLKQLDANYPGGLQKYVTNAKRLLEESKSGREPTPVLPLHKLLGLLHSQEYSPLFHSTMMWILFTVLLACREERL